MRLNKQLPLSQDYTLKEFIITEATDNLLFVLEEPYTLGINQLDVYLNGQWLAAGGGYEEVNPYTIRLDLGKDAQGNPVHLEVGDEVHVKNNISREIHAGAGTGLADLDALRSEVINARKFREGDAPYSSLDARLDAIQTNNSKIVVFVNPGNMPLGEQQVIIRFPFDGLLSDIHAVVGYSPEMEDAAIQLERISQADYENGGAWEAMLSPLLFIEAGKRSSTASVKQYGFATRRVHKGDYFRLNAISMPLGVRDFTIEVTIDLL